MAESNVIAPVFRGANWGIADDIFTGINNSYFYSENLEVRENSKGISLNKKLAQATTSTDKINVIVKADTNLFVAWGASWVCKKCKNGNWSSITTGINQARVSAAVFNDYLYFCTRSVLYKVDTNDFSNSNQSRWFI